MKNFPILYTASDFAIQGASDTYTNGVGMLSDILSAKVTEELNGIYEFEFKYPITGVHYDQIQLQNVVVVKANLRDRTQPFRIYKISRPINGIVAVSAQHISYDLNGIPVLPFGAEDCTSAMGYMNANSNIISHNFVFTTDKSTIAPFVSNEPKSARSMLGGSEGSILDIYGGHYHFDRFTVSLLDDRGIDQGFSLRYGKNLVDISDEYDASEAYTAVLPFWQYVDNEDESNSYTIIGNIVQISNDTSVTPKVKVVDFTENFDEAPDDSQLLEAAYEYIIKNGIEVPNRNISIEYADEPEMMNLLGLGDPVRIYYLKLGVNLTARCVKIVFNPLENRNESVEFGSLRSNIANTIIDINTSVNEDRKQQILESREIVKKVTERLDGFRLSISSKAESSEVDAALGKLEARISESNIENQVKSLIAKMTADEFGLFFDTIKSEFVSQNDVIYTSVTAIEKYIKALDGGLVFGIRENNQDSSLKLKLMNDRIFFFVGKDDVTDLSKAFAYMTNNVFYVDKMNAASSVQIGNSGVVNYLWVKRGNAHLSLRRQ